MEPIDVINYFEENLKIRVVPCNKPLSPIKEYKVQLYLKDINKVISEDSFSINTMF